MSTPSRHNDLAMLIENVRWYVLQEPDRWFSYDYLASLLKCDRDEAAFVMGITLGRIDLRLLFCTRINPETHEYEIKSK